VSEDEVAAGSEDPTDSTAAPDGAKAEDLRTDESASEDDVADGSDDSADQPPESLLPGVTMDERTGKPYPENLSGLTNQDVLEKGYPHLVIEDGRGILAGRVPSQEIADLRLSTVTSIMGEGNVVANYEIDPTIPLYLDTPIIIEDVVTFEYNSTEVHPEFEPLVALGVAALTTVEGSTSEIIAYADARGSEETNLRISQERADNLVALFVEAGIDRSRMTAVGGGELPESTVDDNDEVAARQRRAEVRFISPPIEE